jgi:hypothetical protein
MKSEPETWQAWRRPLGSRVAWRKAPGIPVGGKAEVFAAIQQQFWIADPVEWEYDIQPEGKQPVNRFGSGKAQGPLSQTYKTRVMRPR